MTDLAATRALPALIARKLASLSSPHCEHVETGGNTLACRLCGADMPDYTFDDDGAALEPTDEEILAAHAEACPWRCAVELYPPADEIEFLRRHYDNCPYAGVEWWCMHKPEHVDTDCYEADGNTPANGATDLGGSDAR